MKPSSIAILFLSATAYIAFALDPHLVTSSFGEDRQAPTQEQLNFFESKIRPVLVTHCYECHSADSKIVQGRLRLDSREGVLKGGDTVLSFNPESLRRACSSKRCGMTGLRCRRKENCRRR